MNNKKILKEKFNKSELSKIKSIVKKEIDKIKSKELEREVKKLVSDHLSKMSLKDIDKNHEKVLEDIFKELMQKYHEMFYRQKDIIRNRLKFWSSEKL